MYRITDSGSAPAAPSVPTKAQAFTRYSRIKARTQSIPREDDFFSSYLYVARNVLAMYAVPSSPGTTPYPLPPLHQVRESMADMIRRRIEQGDTHVQIMSDFILGLETASASRDVSFRDDPTNEGAHST